MVNGLGSIRNRDSDAHGQGRKSYRPAERHAALAVNLAGSMALFLMETHEARDAAEIVSPTCVPTEALETSKPACQAGF